MPAAAPRQGSYTRDIVIFVAVFAIALGFQLHLWFPAGVADESLWTQAVVDTAQQVMRPAHFYAASTRDVDPAFLYPGTTIILPASLLVRAGVDPRVALRTTFACLIALAIALVVFACRKLRPLSAWWVPVAALLLFGPFYQGATIASAAVVPLIFLLVLLFILLEERAEKGEVGTGPLILLGLVGGFAAATRLDISALIFGTGLCMLWLSVRWRALVPACTAAVVFVALDPFLWHSPVGYFLNMHASIAMLENSPLVPTAASAWLESLFWAAPIASFSCLLWIIVILFARKALPIPPRLVVWLLCASALLCSVLFIAPFERIWYFYPLFALWEAFLPLLVLALIDAMPEKDAGARFGPRALGIVSVCLFTFAYAFPFLVELRGLLG